MLIAAQTMDPTFPGKLATCMVATICAIGIAHADDAAPTPYRPTISNPAELPAPGWLEMEAGWLDSHAAGNRQSLPYLAKLAFNEDWGVLLGGEFRIRDHREETHSGFGDTSLTLKHRIATGDQRQNLGVEVGIKLPTAAQALGSGKSDYTVNGIYSLDFADDWRLDVNAGATRLGARDPGAGRVAALWAMALSKALGNWTWAGEISGTHQPGLPNSRQWLAAASYAVRSRIVLDAGFSEIQQTHGDGRTLFFGATWLVDKLF